MVFSVIGLLNLEYTFVTWLVLTKIILLEERKEGTNFAHIVGSFITSTKPGT